MIRVVLACLLTVAIAAVVFPAADAARAESTTVHVGAMADELAHAAASLAAAEDPAPAGLTGASRRVTLDVPTGSWRRARVTRLVVRGGDGVALAATTADGLTVARRVGGPRVHVAGERLVLAPGEHEVRLTVRTGPSGPVVVLEPTASRLGG